MLRIVCGSILACCLLFPFADGAAQAADSAGVQAPELRDELLAMETADQEARKDLIAARDAGSGLDTAMVRRVREIDRENTERLKRIVAEHGWPSARMVGEEGVHAAFLVVQHTGDAEFQERMLPAVERSYREGVLEGQAYALLLDRVRVRQGRPQVYGTQMKPVTQWEDGEPVPYPIRDVGSVDERRAKVGLPPLSEYVQLLQEAYGLGEGG